MKYIALYIRVIFILLALTLVGVVCITEYSRKYGDHSGESQSKATTEVATEAVIVVTTESATETTTETVVAITTEASSAEVSSQEASTEDLMLKEDKNVPVEGAVYTGTVAKGHEIYNNEGHDFMTNVTLVANVKQPAVALTFDDGPGGAVTDRILDVLEHYNGRATFFVVGERIRYYPENLKRAYEMGCTIASHTYGHKNLTKLSAKQIQSQLDKTNKKIKEIIGVKAKLVRPPYGSINATTLSRLDVPAILWSIDTRDWESRKTSSVVKIALDQVEDGDIILMHDVYDTTATAVEQIVPELINRGYQLVTIEELATIKGITLQDGEKYSDFK